MALKLDCGRLPDSSGDLCAQPTVSRLENPRIVGWRVSSTIQACFVLDALEQALHDRRPLDGSRPIHYSNRGV